MRSSTAPARVSQIRSEVTVALGQTLGALLAIGRPGLALDFQLHQALGGKADHLAQQIGIRGLLHERAQVHHVVGHRWFLESGCVSQPDLTDESSMTTAKPLARYGAIGGALRERLCSSYTTTWDTTQLSPQDGQIRPKPKIERSRRTRRIWLYSWRKNANHG
jgi:hypothetical protein